MAEVAMPVVRPTAVSAAAAASDDVALAELSNVQISVEETEPVEPVAREYFRSDTFETVFVLPQCQLPDPSELKPVEVFVERAVRMQHVGSDDSHYNKILELLRFKSDAKMLRNVLLALRMAGNGSTLNLLTSSHAKHARLVHQIARINPFELPNPSPQDNSSLTFADYDVADAQLRLILALVSANTIFLVPALNSLWKMLISQYENIPEERSNRIHATLATLTRLCPKSKSELFPIMSQYTPYRARPESELVWYYRQCLNVLHYVPAIQGQVMELIVDKCIEIDVEIKIKDCGEVVIMKKTKEEEEEQEEEDGDAIFQLDVESQPTGSAAAIVRASAPAAAEPEPVDTEVDEMANKLDSLMLLLFEYIHSHATCYGRDSILSLYGIMIRVFESSILVTHRAKFVQFLVLYVCGLDHQASGGDDAASTDTGGHMELVLYRDFATRLIKILLDPYRVTGTRQCAACYLASLISRASYICAETVCEAVSALLRWAEAYMNAFDALPRQQYANDTHGQCDLHSLLYTVCQSAFYIMCFRGVEAIAFYRRVVTECAGAADDDASSVDLNQVNIGSERWTRICQHRLQPLRFCLQSVREEFLNLATMYHLLDANVLQQLMEQCRKDTAAAAAAAGKRPMPRHHLLSSSLLLMRRRKGVATKIATPATLQKERVAGGVGGLGQGTNPLDSFFPFDPFLLRRAHVFIEPFYKHWSAPILHEELEEEHNNHDADEDMDLADAVSDEDEEEDDESDDDDNDSDEGEKFGNDAIAGSFMKAMSFKSQASMGTSLPASSPPLLPSKETFTREGWADTMRRQRAPSVEDGSW